MFQQKYSWILISGSPRRAELLKLYGFDFGVNPVYIDESQKPWEKPREYSERVVRDKLATGKEELGNVEDSLLIATDTSVVLDDEILHKTEDSDVALGYLLKLSGKTHEVITSYRVEYIDSCEEIHETVTTEVTFHKTSESLLKRYVSTGDFKDKAGGYGIQSMGAFLVKELKGSYTNVVGFPLESFIHKMILRGWLT